ncbi:hypothetical protein GUJ93_ZPchr0012g20744 [Zizania palustris]|uniref:CCHC-type domain-containing protein n=1 Tax=Zizania palustris TaxID=103762 RepID=A0A8J6BTX8_ZIZPA|nr:hypothetical protein GUJ93_ZPchr0012g20744 [Zizania palustris]
MVLAIAEKETAKEAWNTLKEIHIGEERVRNANVQILKRELERMYMEDAETIGEYAMKLTTIVNKIRALGTKVEETTVVEKLLHTVPDKFQHIVSTIEQWGDVTKMTMAEAIGRLKAYEASMAGRRRDKMGDQQLLYAHNEPRLTRAEWEAIVAEEKRNGEGSGSNDDKKKYRGKFDKSKVRCYNCQEFGHFADECPEPKKERALHVIADTDDEPTLL